MTSSALPPAYAEMADALLRWFVRNKRPLPWRVSYEPYAVWISEIMLQQTQMERGTAFFERWMRRFPDLASVAEAPEDELLKAFEGLGYYSRVRNLQKAARLILERHQGRIPDSPDELLRLPGIGPYTAGAVASIAYNLPVPAVDANVERVFARLFDLDAPIKSPATADFIRQTAAALIPPGRARDFNQALMELGALVCARRPRCAICPLAAFCQARRLGVTADRPVPGRKAAASSLEVATGVLVHDGRLFVQKRLDTGVWAGFWEFPGGRLEAGETPERAVEREFLEETEFRIRVLRPLGIVRHAYTRYRISLHCFLCVLAQPVSGFPEPRLSAATAYLWGTPAALLPLTFPAGHRKMLEAYGDDINAALAGR